MTDIVDPEYPDLVGIVGGPMMPCKVVEFVETTAAVALKDEYGTYYQPARRYVIRYQMAPVEISYMAGASDEEIEQARQAVVESVLEVVDEQQAPPGRLPTVAAGQSIDAADEYRFVLRLYRRAHGLPVAGTALTASEVNQAVKWWNKRQGTDRG